jgi:hypothetical protein
VAEFNYFGTTQQIKIVFVEKCEQNDRRECLLPFHPESFVILFVIQNYKD